MRSPLMSHNGQEEVRLLEWEGNRVWPVYKVPQKRPKPLPLPAKLPHKSTPHKRTDTKRGRESAHNVKKGEATKSKQHTWQLLHGLSVPLSLHGQRLSPILLDQISHFTLHRKR